jgi:hypothetical protein
MRCTLLAGSYHPIFYMSTQSRERTLWPDASVTGWATLASEKAAVAQPASFKCAVDVKVCRKFADCSVTLLKQKQRL